MITRSQRRETNDPPSTDRSEEEHNGEEQIDVLHNDEEQNGEDSIDTDQSECTTDNDTTVVNASTMGGNEQPPPNDPTPPGEQSSSSAPSQPPPSTTVRFSGQTLPFDCDDPESWFLHFESVLRINRVPELDRFDHLMASLSKTAMTPIATHLRSPPSDPATSYSWLKDLLVNAHGKSTQTRLREILAGQRIGDMSPKLFLNKLQLLAPKSVGEDIIRECWLKELPDESRAILSVIQNCPLDQLVEAAETIHQNEQTRRNACAVRSHPPPSSSSSSSSSSASSTDIALLLEEMRRQFAEIINRLPATSERGRSHSRAPRSSSHRSRSSSQRRDSELCFYHEKYGDDARRCKSPCKHSSKN